MRHRAPRHLLFLKFLQFLQVLKFLKLSRGSRHLLAGRRRAGWLITNQKTRLALAMASVMVLACAAFVAATELPDDDSVAATDVPTHAAQPMRSGTADQVSRSSERAPLDLPYGSPTQDSPDQQAPAPAPEDPQPGPDGTGVPSPDTDGEPASPQPEPAPVAPPELPSQTPTTDGPGAGPDVSSPPTLEVPMGGAPTGPSDGTEEWPAEEPADESSEDWEDGGYDEEYDGEEPTEEESPTPTTTPPTADQTAPETEIVSSPTASESALAASSFEFTANESATFMCSVDGQAYAPCGSPTEYGDLGPGWHTFAVQATDAAGNADPSPAQTSWLAAGADSAPLVGEVTPTEDSLLP